MLPLIKLHRCADWSALLFVYGTNTVVSKHDIIMGLDVGIPDFAGCEQQRNASAQSDQRLCYSLMGKYNIKLASC